MNPSFWISNVLLKKTSLQIKTYICFLGWISIIILIKISSPLNTRSFVDYTDSNFKVLGLNMPVNLEFAGEKVPQNDYEIKESLEKEFFTDKVWQSSSLLLLKKAQKWFPLIEPILKKEGIPDDFKYVAIIESHLSNVVSPMGAAGFWQLMPNTAQHYGLIVNNVIDERLDVEKSTNVACKHFKEAYSYFKNWTLSAAAYNIGIGGIQRALKKQQTNNYYDLLLNKETGSFIYRILAFKTLLANPHHFGLNKKLINSNNFPSFKIIQVDSSITDLKKFASHFETDITILKTFNPWLIADYLTNPEKKTYRFKIPKNKNIDLNVYYNDVFPNISRSDSIEKTITDTTQSVTN